MTDRLTNGITDRERKVLVLVASGFTTAEVAEKIGYSERTVKFDLKNFRDRHGLRNTTHAVAYAIALEMVPVPGPTRAAEAS